MSAAASTVSTHNYGPHDVNIYFDDDESEFVITNKIPRHPLKLACELPLTSWAMTFNPIGASVPRYSNQTDLCELVKNGKDKHTKVVEIKELSATDPTTKKTAKIYVTCLGGPRGGGPEEIVISTFDPRIAPVKE